MRIARRKGQPSRGVDIKDIVRRKLKLIVSGINLQLFLFCLGAYIFLTDFKYQS
jgi:hypothetical protein